MLAPSWRDSPGSLGKSLFASMSVLANFYALLMGLLRTADCISEEKREGTLGLLFLTDLKAYDIVFGKLAATSLNTFYGMLGVFPVLAISLLVGGVTGQEFGRMILVSVNNLFFSLSLGMFCSAISRDEKKAITLALLTMIFLTIVLPFLAELSVSRHFGATADLLFGCLSPSLAVAMAFASTPGTSGGPDYFYAALSTIHALGWMMLLISCVVTPRTWQDKGRSAEQTGLRAIWRRLVFGSQQARSPRRRRMLDENPFFWLTSRDRMKTILVWAVLATMAIFWAFGVTFDPSGWKNGAIYVITGLIAHTILKFWLATEACRQFSLDRKSGALELLLSTSLSVPEIVQGQIMSLRRQFLFPAVVVVLADLIFLGSENDSDATLMWVAGIAMFIADLIALTWLGMWLGLNSRGIGRAAGSTLVKILVLPWLAFLALLTAFAVSSAVLSRVMPRGTDGKMLICIWMFFG